MAVKVSYVCMTLLLLIGTQLATSKSVDEKFKDIKTLSISKRDANEQSKDEETTTIEAESLVSDDEAKEVTPLQVATTETPAKTRRQSDDTTTTTTEAAAPESDTTTTTTTFSEDEAGTTVPPSINEEETPAVKPLGSDREDKDNEENNKVKEQEKTGESDENKPKKPASSYLPPLEDRLNYNEPASNLLPPMPYEYYLLPQSYNNDFILPPPPQAFAPWAIYAQPLPPQPELPTPPTPYDYPHPSGPAFSEPSGGSNGASAYAGGFASASASASAGGSGVNGGTVSVSTSPAGGVQQTASRFGGPTSPQSGLQAQQSATSFSGPAPGGGVYQSSSSHSGPGPQLNAGAQQSASSFSGPAPGGGVYQSSSSHSGPVPKPGPGVQISSGPSFINVRGSFSPDDDESVAIEVDGPARSGAPAYAQGDQGVAISGPGYSASAGYGAGPYGNSIPSYGPSPYGNAVPSFVGPQDFQAMIQQYFAALQAQQMEFQRQLQAQIQAQQQAGGTFASAGAVITNDQGMVDPSAQVYVNTQSLPNSASSATSVDSRSGFGGVKSTVYASPFSNKKNNTSIWDQSNRVDGNFASASGGAAPGGGPQSAFASANYGPGGGYQSGQISPASPGIFSRFGESLPPPSGNSYGVFSSSSSSSYTGPDGKPVNRKVATVGVNDNGKVSVKTVHDP